MPTRPTHNSLKDARNSKTSLSNSNLDSVQYGKQQQPISILLDIPVESLTHVTSYLAPPSLFALSRTCTRLYEHVKDDITWYRAFLTQVVGVGPEGHLKNGKVILLKRLEQTWREEFLLRYRLRQYAPSYTLQWPHVADIVLGNGSIRIQPSLTHHKTPQSTMRISYPKPVS